MAATNIEWYSLMLPSLDDYLHIKNQRVTASFLQYYWSKNSAIWLDETHNWPHPVKISTHSCKRYSWKKNSAISLADRQPWQYWWSKNPPQLATPTNFSSFRSYHLLIINIVLINSFQRYSWSKKTAIWFAESILGHNWKTRIFLQIEFSQNYKEHCFATFLGQKGHMNGLNFWQKPKNPIL